MKLKTIRTYHQMKNYQVQQDVRKENDLPLGSSLETRSNAGEESKQGNRMPVITDNQHLVDTQLTKFYRRYPNWRR